VQLGVKIHPFAGRVFHRKHGSPGTLRDDIRNPEVGDTRQRGAKEQDGARLTAKVDFPVPQSLLDAETQVVLRNFIEENMRRGVPQEQFEKDKQELFAGAKQAAHTRVKSRLLLAKIAEQEKINVTEQDLDTFVYRESVMNNVRPEKIVKDLSKDRDRLRSIQQSIIFDKALDLLVSKATVTTAQATPETSK
jgi:trigger factor